MAGILLSILDLALALARMPWRLAFHDQALLLAYALILLPLAGGLLGALFGSLSFLLRRAPASHAIAWSFRLVLGVVLAVAFVSWLLYRPPTIRGQLLPSILLLAALLLAARFVARKGRRTGGRLAAGPKVAFLVAWLGLVGAAVLASRIRGAPPFAPGLPSKLVLFISVDTLRADALGAYGNVRARTPNMDRLAREGTLFLHAQAAASWTLPSHASMFTGASLTEHGSDAATMTLSSRLPTVTEVLHEHGFRTGGFVSGMWVNSVFGFSRGFDLFDDETSQPWRYLAIPSLLRKLGFVSTFLDIPAERRAGETARRAVRFLDQQGALFLWIHLFDPHTDYDPPEGFRPPHSAGIRAPYDGSVNSLVAVNKGRLAFPNSSQLSALRMLYDGEASYVDSRIGWILEEIERRHLGDRTSILLTSDHGEAFGEHGLFLHRTLHQEVLQVPFLLWAPGRVPAGLRIPDVVRGIDVAPTLASLAGVDWKPAAGGGRSVLPLLHAAGEAPRGARSDRDRLLENGEHALVESSLLVWPWKLHRDAESGSKLFNLEEDPGERVDRSHDRPDLLAQMKSELLKGDRAGTGDSRRTLDPETTRRLKSLGYLQ